MRTSSTSDSNRLDKYHSTRPRYSKFSQQELPAWKPILTPKEVVFIFLAVGAVAVALGLGSLSASDNVVEIKYRYDESCVPPNTENKVEFIQNQNITKTCRKEVTATKSMKGPIYIYYQLHDFYQNHRRFVKSRNEKQLQHKSKESETKDCSPLDKTKSGNKVIVPCGIAAWSMFNDTYKFAVNNKVLDVNKKEIAWGSDKDTRFGGDVYPMNFQTDDQMQIGGAKLNEKIPLNQQEDLMVWMRIAPLSNFRKLYGKIETDIKANDKIIVEIENNYNTYSFNGRKYLVLSTTSWTGGKNQVVGVAFLSIGGITFLFATYFIVLSTVKPRPLGDPAYLSWNKK